MAYTQSTPYAVSFPAAVVQPVRSSGWMFVLGVLGLTLGPPCLIVGSVEVTNSYWDDGREGLGTFLILLGIALWVMGIAFTIAGAVRASGTLQRTHNMTLALLQRNADVAAQVATLQAASGIAPTTAPATSMAPSPYPAGPQPMPPTPSTPGDTASGTLYPTIPPAPNTTYTGAQAPTVPPPPTGPYGQ